MKHSLAIKELVSRSIIRDDYSLGVFNKMTDEEIRVWDKETKYILLKEGIEETFPDWNAAILAKSIDWNILYKIIELNKNAL